MLETLRHLCSEKVIRPLDYQFARFIHDIDDSPLMALTAAAVSHALGKGNVCLELTTLASGSLFNLDHKSSDTLRDQANPGQREWLYELSRSGVVSVAPEAHPTHRPLVLEAGKLYLYRYWHYECDVANMLASGVAPPVDEPLARTILDRLFRRDYDHLFRVLSKDTAPVSDDALRQVLVKWLDVEMEQGIDWPQCYDCVRAASSGRDIEPLDALIPQSHCLNWQKVAAAVAVRQPFAVISGGPGTGKTTTVTRLLALLVELAQHAGDTTDIKLVAPTGKASARLTESISSALPKLNCPEYIRQLIPTQAGTIHRLLGVIPGRPGFRHHAGNPLHLDILVVDEASMIDLTQMRHLLGALPSHARVILLGDRDQLSSVDAGSVLGDICQAAGGGYSASQTETLERLTGFHSVSNWRDPTPGSIQNRLCLLQKSYRFDAASGIGHLAAAVNAGDHKKVKALWSTSFTDIRRYDIDDSGYQHMLNTCVTGYKRYLSTLASQQDTSSDNTARATIDVFNQFRLLCALREGPFGVDGLNSMIRKALSKEHLIPSDALWYTGRPILITENAHGLGLYNGDIGIALPDDNGRLKVRFQMPDGTLKSLLPSRLPQHQTVFAMTIHKSQGSEFSHTVMILPDKLTPVLTRELVYTGITRAKAHLDLYADERIVMSAIKKPTRRSSGLVERLHTRAV